MAEPFFLPYQYGYTGIPSLPLAVFTSLSRLDSERRSLFRERVLLTGGSSRFPGLAARLELELRALVPTPESGERVESILFTRIPKCFSDWQDANSFPALLGGSILAKVCEIAYGDKFVYIRDSPTPLSESSRRLETQGTISPSPTTMIMDRRW
jgi:actin-related protein